MGIITGKETKKSCPVLRVRNKYCKVCNKAAGDTIPQHICFHNWNVSSGDIYIILKGFLHSEEQHGLRYTKFIGDGDSSIFPAVVSGVPYGHYSKKVECANHTVKCYRSALENLINDKPFYKGRGKLTQTMRKNSPKKLEVPS